MKTHNRFVPPQVKLVPNPARFKFGVARERNWFCSGGPIFGL